MLTNNQSSNYPSWSVKDHLPESPDPAPIISYPSSYKQDIIKFWLIILVTSNWVMDFHTINRRIKNCMKIILYTQKNIIYYWHFLGSEIAMFSIEFGHYINIRYHVASVLIRQWFCEHPPDMIIWMFYNILRNSFYCH